MPGKRFSIRDLLVVMTVVAVLMAVGLPMFLRLRADARRMQCSNNFKQVMLGIHNYHSAYKRLPAAMGGTTVNAYRLSGLSALLPFLENQKLSEELSNPMAHQGFQYPAMGPVPWDKQYPVWQYHVPTFRCPSDDTATATGFGRTNITFCIGDNAVDIHKPKPNDDARGHVLPRVALQFRNILDGLSNTIAIGEMASPQGRSVIGQFAINQPQALLSDPAKVETLANPKRLTHYADRVKVSDLGRGGNWADGAAGYSLFQTILPPNAPSAAVAGTVDVDGIFSAASRHPDGVQIGMGDGAVHFVTNSIDVGTAQDQSSAPPLHIHSDDQSIIPSPYGLWGAMGTRASMEAIAQDVPKH